MSGQRQDEAEPVGSGTDETSAAETAGQSLRLVVAELQRAVEAVDPAQLARVALAVEQADRVFVLGQGRSGIAVRALAMRLMHLGYEAHVVGEATAPSVHAGDVLIIASGSGATESVVRAATKAADLGVRVVALTSAPASPLAALSPLPVIVRAAVKTDHGSAASQQYAGSLFEQAVLVVSDALFHALWQRAGVPAEDLWVRHANLE